MDVNFTAQASRSCLCDLKDVAESPEEESASIIETAALATQACIGCARFPHLQPVGGRHRAAIPDDSTCVVLTGSPYQSARPMVNMAVIPGGALPVR